MSRSQVLILGAGAMGHGIGICFADAGWEVTLFDPSDEALTKALTSMQSALELLADVEGSADSRAVEAKTQKALALETMARVSTTRVLPEAIPAVVIEAIPERLPLKQSLLKEVEAQAAVGTLICTNTSAIRIDEIAAALSRPDRFVGTHFWNPPYILPCVEVVRGSETSEETISETMEILRQIGRRPVRLNRDVPGFVGNRLQHALQREALALVESGVVEPEDLDEIVTQSFGLRLAIMGPFERADLGGIDTTTRVHEYLLNYLSNSTTPSTQLTDKVERGDLGIKTGRGFYEWEPQQIEKRIRERDENLLRILALLRRKS